MKSDVLRRELFEETGVDLHHTQKILAQLVYQSTTRSILTWWLEAKLASHLLGLPPSINADDDSLSVANSLVKVLLFGDRPWIYGQMGRVA